MSSRTGFWRAGLLERWPRSLPQAVLRFAIMTAVLVPVALLMGGDRGDALRYCAVFLGIGLVLDLAWLWIGRPLSPRRR